MGLASLVNERVVSASVCSHRCFVADLPQLHDSFVDKLLDIMPRLMASKPMEVIKILQTMLRQSTFLHLPLPEQVRVHVPSPICPET